MSNSLAIAAVTATLRSLLETGVRADPDLNDTTVTTQPLDRARDTNSTSNQVNLFLYHTLPNAAWINMDAPRRVMPGETGMPALALQLYYLVTAYGRDNDTTQPFSHQVLGRAMNILHDHPLLGADEIRTATETTLPRTDLDRQIERVRITLQPLSLEELSKLWTGLQTQYRLSVAYEATVVLIDSEQAARTPLPVLTRGVGSQSSVIAPFPALEKVVLQNGQPSARLGETVSLGGHHLDGTNVGVVFKHPLWTDATGSPREVEVPPQPGGTEATLTVAIPNQPDIWPAGFYTVAVRVQRPDESYRRTTNELSFSLAPTMTIAAAGASPGSITFTVSCSPQVGVKQHGTQIGLVQSATLLLGDREIVAEPPASAVSPTGNLIFVAANVAAGEYFVRLRIDGVDSLLVDRSVTPPKFDQTQKVTVT
jgi:hypothetical protein